MPLMLLVMMMACATPPVQEMSDARQALRLAEESGAAHYSPEEMQAARWLLREAQTGLEQGAYDAARQKALYARDAAIKARDRASVRSSTPP